MEKVSTNVGILQNKASKESSTTRPPVRICRLDFSNRIAGKYSIYTRSGKLLPSLVFFRLAALSHSITYNKALKSENNYFRQKFNLFFNLTQAEKNEKIEGTYLNNYSYNPQFINYLQNNEKTSSESIYPQRKFGILRLTTGSSKTINHIDISRFIGYFQNHVGSEKPKFDIMLTHTQLKPGMLHRETELSNSINHTEIPQFVTYFQKYKNSIPEKNIAPQFKEKHSLELSPSSSPIVFSARKEKIPKVEDILSHGKKETTGYGSIENKSDYRKTWNPEIGILIPLQIKNGLSHGIFHKQMTNGNLKISEDDIFPGMVSNAKRIGLQVLKKGMDTPSETVLPLKNINLQHAGIRQGNKSTGLKDSANNVVGKHSDLILKESVKYASEDRSENIKKISEDINEHVSTKTIPVKSDTAEIDIIADRVYGILETKLLIEKERRGLR